MGREQYGINALLNMGTGNSSLGCGMTSCFLIVAQVITMIDFYREADRKICKPSKSLHLLRFGICSPTSRSSRYSRSMF